MPIGGAPAPAMVEVGQVRREIRLSSLLFGPITIEQSSNCASVAIRLEQNVAGDGNWAIAPSDVLTSPKPAGWKGCP